MDCTEYRENLVSYLEGLCNEAEASQYQEHLESCAACRMEHEATARLQERLSASGRAAAEVSLVGAVMRQIRVDAK